MISFFVSFILLYVLHKILPNTISVALIFKTYALGSKMCCFSFKRHNYSIFLVIFTAVSSSHVDPSVA